MTWWLNVIISLVRDELKDNKFYNKFGEHLEQQHKWFIETYGREWEVIDLLKYKKFLEQFEQQYKRAPNLEEGQEFFQDFMSNSKKEQEPQSLPKWNSYVNSGDAIPNSRPPPDSPARYLLALPDATSVKRCDGIPKEFSWQCFN